MKTNKTKILLASMSVALVVTVAVAVVSCQKEPASEQHGPVTDSARELAAGNQFLERIVSFGNLLESYANGDAGRETMYMAVSEAMVNIEALFNYTYSNLNETYGQTVALDTTLHLLVTVDDSVAMPELADFYGRMHNAVRDLYHSVSLPDKRFLILDVEEGTVQNGKKAILLHTVQGSVIDTGIPPEGDTLDPGPFPPGVFWYYGNNQGNIPNGGNLDAADTLSMVLNQRLNVTPPEGMSYFYYNIRNVSDEGHWPFTYSLYPEEGPYCEFFKENPTESEKYLSPDQMNFHYFGERHLVKYILPLVASSPIPTGHVLFQVVIQEYSCDDLIEVIGHHTQAFYGERVLVAHEDIEKDL